MYTIYADKELLYAPTLAGEGYTVLNPKVEVELNKSGSASFRLPPDNDRYNDLQKLKTEINIYDDDDEIFHGRILHDEKGFYNIKDVYCEGELAYLVDSRVRPYSFRGSVRDLVKTYLESHNSQADEWKRFQLGEITVTDPNDYITRDSSDYPRTLDEMQAKLVKLLGGYLRTRLTDGVRYLDYVTDYGSVSDQTIEFGKNLLDINEYITAENVFTVLIPLGAEQKDEEGNSAGRLTISEVNDGKDYIEDADAIKLFGRIVSVETWDDVTVASNLLTKGREHLKKGIEMAVSLSIKAVDLHLIDVDVKRIKLGDMVRVVSLPHGLDKYFLCSKISYDLVNPQNTEYTFGVTFSTMTDKQVSQQKAAENNISAVKDAAQSAQDSSGQANEKIKEVEQVIAQIPTEYVKTTTFEQYQEEASEKYALKMEIPPVPTKVSELDNDAGYMTGESVAAGYIDKETYNSLVDRVKKLEEGVTV